VHQWHIDQRRLIDDEQIAFEWVLLVVPEAAMPGIDFEQTMDSLRLPASALAEPLRARPVGAASAILTSLAPSTLRIELISVVLPTPGPPVMTRTFESRASRSAVC
jgi:hypothetical protein